MKVAKMLDGGVIRVDWLDVGCFYSQTIRILLRQVYQRELTARDLGIAFVVFHIWLQIVYKLLVVLL